MDHHEDARVYHDTRTDARSPNYEPRQPVYVERFQKGATNPKLATRWYPAWIIKQVHRDVYVVFTQGTGRGKKGSKAIHNAAHIKPNNSPDATPMSEEMHRRLLQHDTRRPRTVREPEDEEDSSDEDEDSIDSPRPRAEDSDDDDPPQGTSGTARNQSSDDSDSDEERTETTRNTEWNSRPQRRGVPEDEPDSGLPADPDTADMWDSPPMLSLIHI